MSARDAFVALGERDEFSGPHKTTMSSVALLVHKWRALGEARGWHADDLLPPPILMPKLCPSLAGSDIETRDVVRAIWNVAERCRNLQPELKTEPARRAMVLMELEALLHERRPRP